MKFLRQNFVPEVAAMRAFTLFTVLSAGAPGLRPHRHNQPLASPRMRPGKRTIQAAFPASDEPHHFWASAVRVGGQAGVAVSSHRIAASASTPRSRREDRNAGRSRRMLVSREGAAPRRTRRGHLYELVCAHGTREPGPRDRPHLGSHSLPEELDPVALQREAAGLLAGRAARRCGASTSRSARRRSARHYLVRRRQAEAPAEKHEPRPTAGPTSRRSPRPARPSMIPMAALRSIRG